MTSEFSQKLRKYIIDKDYVSAYNNVLFQEGAILVFVPGWSEIDGVYKRLNSDPIFQKCEYIMCSYTLMFCLAIWDCLFHKNISLAICDTFLC